MSETNTAVATQEAKETKETKKKGKKAQAAPKAEKPKIKLDKFGSRVGSGQHKINQVLSKKPRSAAEILKLAEVKNGYYHLKRLADQKKILHTEEGYALKPKDLVDSDGEPNTTAS